MKTALQELIEEMQRAYTLPYVNGTMFMQGTMKYAKELLEKEKEQIIDAYYGQIDGVFGYREEGQEYYNKTYTQDRELGKEVTDLLENYKKNKNKL
jgi:hypothetical protein